LINDIQRAVLSLGAEGVGEKEKTNGRKEEEKQNVHPEKDKKDAVCSTSNKSTGIITLWGGGLRLDRKLKIVHSTDTGARHLIPPFPNFWGKK
jgi:hypothetical protein